MFGKTNTAEASETHLLPQLRLRERTDEHPMAMFAAIVSAAFISFALLPSTQSAFASTPANTMTLADVLRSNDKDSADIVRTTAKTGRLPAATETARACEGQAWGDESLECLLVIAREGGKEGSIRMIAEAEPVRTTPNVF
jgi:hypothetical protein